MSNKRAAKRKEKAKAAAKGKLTSSASEKAEKAKAAAAATAQSPTANLTPQADTSTAMPNQTNVHSAKSTMTQRAGRNK